MSEQTAILERELEVSKALEAEAVSLYEGSIQQVDQLRKELAKLKTSQQHSEEARRGWLKEFDRLKAAERELRSRNATLESDLRIVQEAADAAEKRWIAENAQLREVADGLAEALEFYADSENYFAITMLADRPCGAFADDFSDCERSDGVTWMKPGKLAREALAAYDRITQGAGTQ